MKQNTLATIQYKLLNSLKVKRSDLIKYFSQRDINPVIQWQWEALTVVDAVKRIIYFPNGNTRSY